MQRSSAAKKHKKHLKQNFAAVSFDETMKLFIQLTCCIVLGALVVAVACYFSSGSRQLRRNLENASLPRVRLENVTLKEVAAIMETNLAKQGVHCKVIVDSAIADKSVHLFLVGDANGLFWLYGFADVFQCRFMLCDNEVLLLLKK